MISSCATAPPTTSTATSGADDTITFATEPAQLGLILRELGPVLPQNVALMHGVHTRELGPYNFRNAPAELVLNTLAQDAALVRMPSRTYEFLAPADYPQLNALNISRALPPTFTLPSGAVAIGADTPLFDALALLSQAFNTTLVADNAVADARSGELSLRNVNGIDALEALLKSARLDRAAFRIEVGENYVFLYASGNAHRSDVIVNRATFTEAQRTMLERRVDLRLPDSADGPANVGAYASATPLRNVLVSLSTQLGVPVTADPRLHRFPVNPCRMNDVTLETALKLLLNQWLAQDFVVEVTESGLHIRPVS